MPFEPFMHIYYLSNSLIPSRKANSVQVMKMCQSFSKLGHEVILFCRKPSDDEIKTDPFEHYGIETRSGSLSESVSILLSIIQGDFEDNCTEEQLAKSTGLVHPDRCVNDYAIKVRIRTSNRIT